MSVPEVWLRGAVEGYDPLLVPVAHALLQVREDVERLAARVPDEVVWQRAGEAASIGFHLQHIAGSLDRLLTYARGEPLSGAQRDALNAEAGSGGTAPSLNELTAGVAAAVDLALAQLRATRRETLLEPRAVGRAGLPSTVIGLLVHAAEHAARHTGQAITTAKILTTR